MSNARNHAGNKAPISELDLKIINKLLATGVERGASDIHLRVGDHPLYRVDGALKNLKFPKLSPEATKTIASCLISNPKIKADLDSLTEHDTSYSLDGVGRFRVNIFKQRDSFAIIMRIIPTEILPFKALGLPQILEEIALAERGLILLTGATGMGKSTTISAMLDFINQHYKKHIITVEDPIEHLYENIQSSFSQREIGKDTESFAKALRAAMRQDPDIIMVGEMRDRETVDVALNSAETGHLVLSSVHTTDAQKTIGRLVALFPSDEQAAVRVRMAENIVATISQRLLPRNDGRGRIVAVEVMRSTRTIQECIVDPLKTSQISEHIAKGRGQYGMQTFDQHLLDLVRGGKVSLEVAKTAATNPSDLERNLQFE